MTDIQHQVIAYADARELSVVRQLVHAVHDAIDVKGELGLPLLPETRAAIDDLEAMIVDLKLSLLRHHPDQTGVASGPSCQRRQARGRSQ